jgi:hypothetical protein
MNFPAPVDDSRVKVQPEAEKKEEKEEKKENKEREGILL